MKELFANIAYILIMIPVKLIGLIPRWCHRCIAFLFSRVMYLIPQMGGLVRMNLKSAFPEKTEKERNRIAVKVYNSCMGRKQKWYFCRYYRWRKTYFLE